MESDAAKKPAAPPKAKPPQEPMRPLPVATPGPAKIVEGGIRTRWYWITLLVATASLVIVLLYYNTGLYPWLQILYWISGVLAAGLIVWSIIGLLTRFNVLTRIGASAQRRRDLKDAQPDKEEQIVYRENPVVRLFKFVVRLVTLLFLFVWNTFLRLWYIVRVIIGNVIIFAADLLYYPTYWAWTIAFYALRLARAIVLWALRTAWKILRILTYLPIAKGLWRNRFRPQIMGKWHARQELRRQTNAGRLEQKKRLVAARGLDPEKWQAERVARHYYPFPKPEGARRALRSILLDWQKADFNRRDRWQAYRQGKPLPPKYHSERKKAKLEEQKKRKDERRQKERDERGSDKDEKRIKRAKEPKAERRSAPLGDARPVADDE